MRIGLINIGDELLLGKTLNTNAFDAAVRLGELGHELVFTLAVGDIVATIAGCLREVMGTGTGALPRCEMLLLTGGLGPTHDDLTRQAVAEFLGVPLVYSDDAAQWLADRLKVSVGAISEGQRTQLDLPRGATALHNPAGTACGFRFDRGGVSAFAFPGVPSEWNAMFAVHCLPLLERRDAMLLRRKLITFGLSESRQRELLRGFVPPPPFRFSSLPAESGVVISLEAFVPQAEIGACTSLLETSWEELWSRLPEECVVDRGGLSLPEAVFAILRARNVQVSVAESCTAGALGYLLTETPGSSAVFHQGFLTYANAAKTQLLGVPKDLLEAHGAVSEPVALAMARGCRLAANTEYAVAITGIAGPDGGTAEKPVGLVFIAVASPRGEKAQRFHFRGDRKSIRWCSAYTALNMLRSFIINDL